MSLVVAPAAAGWEPPGAAEHRLREPQNRCASSASTKTLVGAGVERLRKRSITNADRAEHDAEAAREIRPRQAMDEPRSRRFLGEQNLPC
jgi:hypothetical protein